MLFYFCAWIAFTFFSNQKYCFGDQLSAQNQRRQVSVPIFSQSEKNRIQAAQNPSSLESIHILSLMYHAPKQWWVHLLFKDKTGEHKKWISQEQELLSGYSILGVEKNAYAYLVVLQRWDGEKKYLKVGEQILTSTEQPRENEIHAHLAV